METSSHDEEEATTWTTKTGQVLTIKYMTTSHLWNVLRMLDRRELAVLAAAPMHGPPSLFEIWEKHTDALMPSAHPAYPSIVKELHKRGEITYEDMNEIFGWEGVD